jgi:hypothetical protein
MFVVALWGAFFIENQRLGLDILRVPDRSPASISKCKDFRGQSVDIWGARGPHVRPILGVPGVRACLKTHFWPLIGHHVLVSDRMVALVDGSTNVLSSSLSRMLDFRFDGGTEHVTKCDYNWSPGLIFMCVLHYFSSRARPEGSWGPVRPTNVQKSTTTKI